MASITSTGLGSGLDIGGLVSQLVAAEGAPASRRLDRQEREASATLSALGTLKSALSSLQSGIEKAAEAADTRAYQTASSQEEVLTATAGEEAAPGSYQIEVMRLAQRHKLGSDAAANSQTFGGTAGDELVLSVGAASMRLDLSSGKTLAGIRDAINGAADNPGITASLIRIDDSQEVLSLTAAETGQAQAITASETLAAGPSLSLDTLNRDAHGQAITDLAELDAAVRIDGIDVTRRGNRLTDVIEGVSLDLVKAEAGTQVGLTVEPDQGPLSEAIKGFVGKYNGFVAALGGVAGYKGAGADQPALFGDALARNLASQLRTELGRRLEGGDGAFAALAEIGIASASDGKLSLDESKLEEVLESDAAGVAALFDGKTGIAAGLDSLIAPYLGTGGVLETRSNSIKEQLDGVADSREALERRLDALETRYQRKFAAMDALVGQLMTTGNFLSQQFAALGTKGS